MEYKVLEVDGLPEVPQKPRWAWCAVFITAVLVITMSAITMGMFLGYTYCYIEHRTNFQTGNITRSTNLQIVHMPYPETEETKHKRTINGALMSSVVISRLLKIGRALVDDEIEELPFAINEF